MSSPYPSFTNGCWFYRFGRKSYSFRNHWCRRYFVLCGDQLQYFKDETDTKPWGVIDLSQYQVDVRFDDQRVDKDVFRHIRTTQHESPIIVLRADNVRCCQAWLENQPQSPLPMQPSSLLLDNDNDDVLSKCLEKLDLATPAMTPSASNYSSTSSISSLPEPVKDTVAASVEDKPYLLSSLLSTLRQRTKPPKPTSRADISPVVSNKQPRHPLVNSRQDVF